MKNLVILGSGTAGTMMANHLVKKLPLKKREKLDMPPVGEFLEILSDSGCKLWACKLAVDMFKLEEKDLIDELDGILTIGDFYSRANQDNTHLLFI